MKPVRSLLSVAVTAALVATPLALTSGAAAQAAASTPASASPHMHINCAYASGLCTEVHNSYGVFDHYVGHGQDPRCCSIRTRRDPATTCAIP